MITTNGSFSIELVLDSFCIMISNLNHHLSTISKPTVSWSSKQRLQALRYSGQKYILQNLRTEQIFFKSTLRCIIEEAEMRSIASIRFEVSRYFLRDSVNGCRLVMHLGSELAGEVGRLIKYLREFLRFLGNALDSFVAVVSFSEIQISNFPA
jgi:hypothetical protein